MQTKSHPSSSKGRSPAKSPGSLLEIHEEILTAEGSLFTLFAKRKVPILTPVKAEIKQIFAELTVSLKKHFTQLSCPPVLSLSKLELRTKALAEEYGKIRKGLNQSKQNALTLLGGLKSRLGVEQKDVEGARMKCEDMQNELERLLSITDCFDTVSAKSEGLIQKLMNNCRNLPKTGEKISVSSPETEQMEKIKSQLLAVQLRFTLQSDQAKKLGAIVKQQKAELEEKRGEAEKLRRHLGEYVGLSEEQYAQIETLKREAGSAALNEEIVRNVKDFLSAMDYLGYVITEDKTSEISQAKSNLDQRRERLEQLVVAKSPTMARGKQMENLLAQTSELKRALLELREEFEVQISALAKSSMEGLTNGLLRKVGAEISRGSAIPRGSSEGGMESAVPVEGSATQNDFDPGTESKEDTC